MILSGREIQKGIDSGKIVIKPFKKSRINPNSYNLTLSNKLLVYKDKVLDMKKKPETMEIIIPEEGLVLEPGKLYLARTEEWTETSDYVPMLEGRSSIGRLGMYIHVTAGFGDIGFKGYWTLEIQCIQPLKIYPGVEIGQIYYHTICGDYDLYSSGKYSDQTEIRESRMYMDFDKEKEEIEI